MDDICIRLNYSQKIFWYYLTLILITFAIVFLFLYDSLRLTLLNALLLIIACCILFGVWYNCAIRLKSPIATILFIVTLLLMIGFSMSAGFIGKICMIFLILLIIIMTCYGLLVSNYSLLLLLVLLFPLATK